MLEVEKFETANCMKSKRKMTVITATWLLIRSESAELNSAAKFPRAEVEDLPMGHDDPAALEQLADAPRTQGQNRHIKPQESCHWVCEWKRQEMALRWAVSALSHSVLNCLKYSHLWLSESLKNYWALWQFNISYQFTCKTNYYWYK